MLDELLVTQAAFAGSVAAGVVTGSEPPAPELAPTPARCLMQCKVLAVANTRLGRRRSDQPGQDIEGLWYQPVIGPLASLLTGQDSGFDQNLQVMGHGRLR